MIDPAVSDVSAAGRVGAPPPELALAHLDALPTLPPIALRLLQTINDRDADASDVIALLRHDQSLTARILALAGAVATGAGSPITTVERAVSVLGFSVLRSVVLTVKVFETLGGAGDGGPPDGFDRVAFWKHAVAVGCAARRLAEIPAAGVDPEEAFVAGLLHDLGKVALDATFPRSYVRIARRAVQVRGDIADCERALLGVDHTVAGRRVAERWGLPRVLQEVIWLHHLAADGLPASVLAPRLITLVQLADTVVREQRLGFSGNHVFYESVADLAALLGITPAQVDGVILNLPREVAEQVVQLGLEHDVPETMFLRSLQSANAELGRMNSELQQSNQRLGAAARYFRALTSLDEHLTATSDCAAVVSAITRCAHQALQRPRVAAFALRDGGMVDLSVFDHESATGITRSDTATLELREWRARAGAAQEPGVHKAPPAVRMLLAQDARHLGPGELWLCPVTHAGVLQGGLIFAADDAAIGVLRSEMDELRAFLTSLGLAIGRANAQAAAQRLTDELAETNRRLQHLRTEVLRSRTLGMIAEMAAGAGHELNSPLSVIAGRAQMLLESSADPEARRVLQLIDAKAHECSRIVSELMDIAQPPPPRPEPIEAGQLVADARTAWLSESAAPAAQVTVRPAEAGAGAPTSAQVLVDRGQLRGVLIELLRNAAASLPAASGQIEISWRVISSDLEPRTSARLPAAPVPHDWVEILVRDNGSGMEQSVLRRAFDPFFSHQTAGRRRGLGLARAHRVIEAHGGRIWLESEPRAGTTAHVLLPQSSR